MTKPLVVELYCGTFGWSAGWLALGGQAIGFDLEHEAWHGPIPNGAELVLQDVRTLHGSQFKNADLILGSSPCQEFSYRAMPWKRAKALGPPELGMELFYAQFRIQREASEAAGRWIPMVVENVRGAQKWIGKSRWNFGSYHLWGDVPALMPTTLPRNKGPIHGWSGGTWTSDAAIKSNGGAWFNIGSPGQKVTNRNPVHEACKVPSGDGGRRTDIGKGARFTSRPCGIEQQPNPERGTKGFATRLGESPNARHGSKSSARRAASAAIARIPDALSQHIAHTFYPRDDRPQAASTP